jgi:hypothetical protein
MKNPATHTYCDELNSFTNVIVATQRHGGTTKVRLRNGDVVEPIYKLAEDHSCEDCFSVRGTNGYWYYWNLDGTSPARNAFDMMELV